MVGSVIYFRPKLTVYIRISKTSDLYYIIQNGKNTFDVTKV